MKDGNASANRTTRRIRLVARAAALTAAIAASMSQPVHAAQITPPPMPGNIQVPVGHKAFLVGHAVGTQNYVCVPSASSPSGVAFVLFTPQATLFDDHDKQIITHFFSPNPSEPNTNPAVSATGLIRATWQHSRDTSTVWAKLVPGGTSSDSPFVAPNSVPWLLLEKAGVQEGPTDVDILTETTFIQRLNTSGGVAPSTGCNSPADLGKQAFVPYTADYFFYERSHNGN